MARNLQNEPLLAVTDIQGDILVGLPKNHEHLIFFEIANTQRFKAFLKDLEITTADECLAKRAAIAAHKAANIDTIIPAPGLNIAFTYNGLQHLNSPVPASTD